MSRKELDEAKVIHGVGLELIEAVEEELGIKVEDDVKEASE